jgi:ketosteroid isomerase-like protein
MELSMEMETGAIVVSTRRVALAFLSAYWRAELSSALVLCAGDAVIELPKSIAIATPALIRDVLPVIFSEVYQRFVDGRFDVVIERTIAEESVVFVEYRASGDLMTGHKFDCRYGVLLEVQEERVVLFRQYTDTQYVTQALLS